MKSIQSRDRVAPAGTFQSAEVLVVAVWFGLVTGLVEGAGLLLLQELGWRTRNPSVPPVSLEIIWIAPVFDFLLFGALGLAVIAVGRFFSRIPVMRSSVFLFAFMAFFDWIALSGRIRHRGMLVLAVGLAVVFTRWFGRNQARTLHFWRRTLPWVAAVAVLAVIGIPGGVWLQEWRAVARLPQAPKDSPNILVIVVDTLRADHLSAYGYTRPTSPNLERLAQQGVLFENAFSTSPWTLPSHASLLTGQYPYERGARDRKALNSRFLTIAEVLRARGYRTAAFSANLFWFTRQQGFGRGFIRFEDYFHSKLDMAWRTLYGGKLNSFVLRRLGFEDVPGRRRASDINSSVQRWIDRDRDKPFFVFLNYFDVHSPYLPLQPYRSRFSKQKNPGGILNNFVGRLRPRMTPTERQGEIDAYDGAISYVDHQIGDLLAQLRRRGLAKKTLVVITSDHGELFGEHDLFLHGNALYRDLIHVPLLFWWPGHVPARLRVAQPVTNAALPATVMELVGMGEQAPFPGPSLTQLWQDPDAYPDWPHPLAEHTRDPMVGQNLGDGSMKSLVSPQWHYILTGNVDEELYDWVRDPGELNNLALTPAGRSVARDFTAYLQRLLARPEGASLESPGKERNR